MIDLMKFCGKEDPREWLNAPFSLGDYTYATNGHLIVRVPRVAEYADLDNPALVGIESFSYSFDRDGDYLEIPDLPPVVGDEKSACTECGGDCICVHCGQGECPECDGTGEVIRSEYGLPVDVGCAAFSHIYLALIKDIGGKILPDTKETAAKFIFDGGDGILMPIRK